MGQLLSRLRPNDCLYALQPTIPHLSRSTLHRCLQRHGISRLPDTRDKPKRKAFKKYPIGYFHVDIAEINTEEGCLYFFVGTWAAPQSSPMPNCTRGREVYSKVVDANRKGVS